MRQLYFTFTSPLIAVLVLGCNPGASNSGTASAAPVSPTDSSKVYLQQEGEKWSLIRNGQPYFIKGAGGDTYLEKVVSAGGNSIRTWGTANLGEVLDRAHANGLTVTAGLWLGHERHGFNYADEAALQKQRSVILATVEKYKSHPALLMWGIGNEMEGKGENTRIWKEINTIAASIKDIDPHHPTMTVLAEASPVKINNLKAHCPNIDVLGVNSYGGLRTIPKRLRDLEWKKPYIVTEFGPPGPWESGKTSWGAPIELNSTQKAEIYARNYREGITASPSWCLGSYAFKWGHKQEATATWFGMLLPDGTMLGTVDAMTSVWTGQPANHLSPTIQSLSLKAEKSADANPAQTYATNDRLTASVQAISPHSYPLKVKWDLREENTNRKQGGDKEADPDAVPLPPTNSSDQTITFSAPTKPGPYRLFIYVSDGNGKAATANIPILIKAP
jgi:hypothetical protein